MRNYLKHNYLLDFQGMVCLRVGGETLELIWFSQEMLQRKKNMFFNKYMINPLRLAYTMATTVLDQTIDASNIVKLALCVVFLCVKWYFIQHVWDLQPKVLLFVSFKASFKREKIKPDDISSVRYYGKWFKTYVFLDALLNKRPDPIATILITW